MPTKALFALLVVALLLPDIDFAIGWVWPGSILGTHAGGTHSFAFTAVAAVVAAIGWQLCFRQTGLKVFLWLLAALWSHVLMDAVTWGGQGVAMFWPMTEMRIASPIRVFYGVRHSEPLAWQLHLVTLVTELAFAAGVVVIARRLGRGKQTHPDQLSPEQ